MGKRKKEDVTFSFHYFYRRDPDNEEQSLPVSRSDFDALASRLLSFPDIDLSDQQVLAQIAIGRDLPLEKVEQVNSRCLFGSFRGLYSGHAYDNTHKGKIPAESTSLRPFFFLLYLGKSGRLYLGSQYLGLFGGYTPLSSTLRRLIPACHDVQSRSYRDDGAVLANVQAKEVRVSFVQKAKKPLGRSQFGRGGMITFRQTDEDTQFQRTVKEKLLAQVGHSPSQIKRTISTLLKDNDLISINDEDIEDCAVVTMLDGKSKIIHLIESGSVATKFPIKVGLDADGHPDRQQTRTAALEVLKREIISRAERDA